MLGHHFDPNSDFCIEETCRPHWSQAGTVVFVTFRTADSIPASVLKQWEREKAKWLAHRGFAGKYWKQLIQELPAEDRKDFNILFNRKRERMLDRCHGACLLSKPELSAIVSEALLLFDRERYRLGDFVVMPNHVHLLCVFLDEETMRIQFDSWQKYSATKINRAMSRQCRFWQGDPFDHLVRSPEQYDYLRRYIAENPTKAKLKQGDYLYRRYEG